MKKLIGSFQFFINAHEKAEFTNTAI